MLSATSEYALWALIALADRRKNLLARDLAERTDVPLSYLSKILATLKRAGVLESARGAGGGYRLAREADSIRLVDVVELFEVLSDRSGCILGQSGCDEDNPCAAHASWAEVRQTYLAFLENHTIGELARSSGRRPG